jgi:hypothetical protein
LVAIAAAFLGGMRFGEYREANRRKLTYFTFKVLPTAKWGEVKAAIEEVIPPLNPPAGP